MESYNAKSCSALYKGHYRPIDAALRWCNLIDHEVKILNAAGDAQYPPVGSFPQWPCLHSNIEKIIDAIENGDLPCGRDGKKVTPSDHVAPGRRTIRHHDLKVWIAKYHPDQKPTFLFDEIERTTHAAINAESFQALQVDRDSLKARLDNGIELYNILKQDRNKIESERASLAAKVEKMNNPTQRSETTYLNIIGALVELIQTKKSGRDSEASVISELVNNYSEKAGISERTLQEKFAAAKRSLQTI